MGEIDKYADWQFKQLNPYLKGNVLEIGAGIGTLTQRILSSPYVTSCSVTETNARNRSILEHKFSSTCQFISDINLEKGVASSFISAFDTVLSVNVLEHVFDDKIFFANCCKCLKPGGYIVKLVPAKKFLFGTIDKADNHYRRYEPADLRAMAADNQLKIVKLYYFNFLGAIGWFYHGKILKVSVHEKSDLKLLNSVIPVLKRLERFIPIPFGLSLILVARKTY